MSHSLSDLIELGDSDELLREIDRRSSQRDWDGLLELRDRCRLAVERGKQLWGAAAHAEYRLALEAPGEIAASVVESTPAPFALGPLPEVAASSHKWSELRESLPDGPIKGITAYECVVRGADLSGHEELNEHVVTFELPMTLQSWEPDYPLAEYKDIEAKFPRPALQLGERVDVAAADHIAFDDPDTADALARVTATWESESNGSVQTVAVEGGLAEVLSVVGATTATSVSSRDAIALLAWAGASGGVHGRRSGMASGRSKAWWALAALTGSVDDWPLPPDELGRRVDELQWFVWGTDDLEGFVLRLAIVDPIDEVAFAIDSTDRAE